MSKEVFDTLPRPPIRKERLDAPLSPRLIVEISRLLRARMQREEHGIMAQSTARLVMAHLANEGTLGQLDLVHLTHLKPPSVSVILRRMEEEGYITRIPDEKDRRAVRVALTQKGWEFDHAHLRRLSTNDHLAMQGLSAEEQATLESLLLRVRDNLTEA